MEGRREIIEKKEESKIRKGRKRMSNDRREKKGKMSDVFSLVLEKRKKKRKRKVKRIKMGLGRGKKK